MESFPLPVLIVQHPCLPCLVGGLWEVGEESFRLPLATFPLPPLPCRLPPVASCPSCVPGEALEAWTKLSRELVLGTQLAPGSPQAGAVQTEDVLGRRGPDWGRGKRDG